MSRVYIGFLAACLAAAASLFSVVPATAQQQPAAITIDPTAATEIAQAMDEAAFKQMLVKNSPWSVIWQGGTTTGTHDMSFALSADGALTGKIFNRSRAGRDSTLEEIIVKEGRVNFVSADTGTKFEYRLSSDGALSGVFNGMSKRGGSWEGTLVAKPAAR